MTSQRMGNKGGALTGPYLSLVGALLIGYAILNKGFAYIGVAPIYIGEIVLAVSFFMVVIGAASLKIIRSPIVWALFAFMMWNLLRTLPYLDVYGITALRDAVLWGYAFFALIIAGVLLRSNSVEQVVRWYGSWMPWFLLLAPIMLIITEIEIAGIPEVAPDVPIILMKAGDMGVHIGGALAFLALGLHKIYPRRMPTASTIREAYLWTFAVAGLLIVAMRNRGGFVAALAAAFVVTVFRPFNRLSNLVVPLVVVASFLVLFDVRVPIGGDREISPQQMIDNVSSLVGGGQNAQGYLQETTEWRLIWWSKIADDTIYGDFEHFMLGRGYGFDIATQHGFSDRTNNRSPHNGHMNLLARSGVPGLLLWLTLLITIFWCLLRCALRARRRKDYVLASINLWVMAYGTAFLVNASFDVFLEGPQGGIWFWCLVGFAIALTEWQSDRRYETGVARPTARLGAR